MQLVIPKGGQSHEVADDGDCLGCNQCRRFSCFVLLQLDRVGTELREPSPGDEVVGMTASRHILVTLCTQL